MDVAFVRGIAAKIQGINVTSSSTSATIQNWSLFFFYIHVILPNQGLLVGAVPQNISKLVTYTTETLTRQLLKMNE